MHMLTGTCVRRQSMESQAVMLESVGCGDVISATGRYLVSGIAEVFDHY